MMESQFVPYELALKLKKLGFNEPCFYWYGKANKLIELQKETSIQNNKFINLGDNVKHICTAPLWQQAFDWFREKYKLLSFIDIDFSYRIYWDDIENNLDIDSKIFNSYEEARLACLEKLIEIIQNETNNL